jgi:hypothetical protein
MKKLRPKSKAHRVKNADKDQMRLRGQTCSREPGPLSSATQFLLRESTVSTKLLHPVLKRNFKGHKGHKAMYQNSYRFLLTLKDRRYETNLRLKNVSSYKLVSFCTCCLACLEWNATSLLETSAILASISI